MIGWGTDVNTFYVDDLCVDPSHRSHKIRTKLMLFVMDFGKEQRYKAIDFNVWSKNIDAMRFYLDLGFEPLKQVLTYKL